MSLVLLQLWSYGATSPGSCTRVGANELDAEAAVLAKVLCCLAFCAQAGQEGASPLRRSTTWTSGRWVGGEGHMRVCANQQLQRQVAGQRRRLRPRKTLMSCEGGLLQPLDVCPRTCCTPLPTAMQAPQSALPGKALAQRAGRCVNSASWMLGGPSSTQLHVTMTDVILARAPPRLAQPGLAAH